MSTFSRRKSRGKVEENNLKKDLLNDDEISSNDYNNYQILVPSLSSSINNRTSSNILYLQNQYAIFTRSISQCNIGELIRQPEYVDKNEWIAHNIVTFFNHINALYEVLSEFCTKSTCSTMTGPQNSLYYWIDERGKKLKCSAPQYIDSAMTFMQKILSNDMIFPTRLDRNFPATFDMLVRKMVRLLFHCMAHIYAIHYRQLIEFELHPHLNSLFLHFISFIIKSDIIPSDYSISNTNTNTNSLTISNQIEIRELRAELESLSLLYELLAKQWQHAYAQANAQKRKMTNNQ
ncbi:unnamed protein product [Adineta steineri]|uniref:Uncharacterized protein n=1 Tax=Adineta steineri TaxID=433720 RepID=A0A818YH37_9BILA|nr:unnamed protein product [Adineta steineri]CAF3754223.1 unnamed protein product [Adineta steineri]